MHFLAFACIKQIRRLNADKEFACLFVAYDNANALHKSVQSCFPFNYEVLFMRALFIHRASYSPLPSVRLLNIPVNFRFAELITQRDVQFANQN